MIDMDNLEEEYEYYEQMISIYQQQQKKILKKFKRLENFGELDRMIDYLKIFIPTDVLLSLLDHKFIMGLSALKLVNFQVQYFLLAYCLCRFADKSLGVDRIEKNLEKLDLEQLAIDLYNFQEKEKGCLGQMRQCNRQYFEEKKKDEAKVYGKR